MIKGTNMFHGCLEKNQPITLPITSCPVVVYYFICIFMVYCLSFKIKQNEVLDLNRRNVLDKCGSKINIQLMQY